MHTTEASEFPCPFCRSGAAMVIGGCLIFVYYQCDDCSEVWTVTQHARPHQLWQDGEVGPTLH